MHDYSSGRGQNSSLSSISLHATYDSAEINWGIGNNVSRRYYVEGRQLIGGKLDFILADSPMKFLPASRSLLACPPSGHAGPTPNLICRAEATLERVRRPSLVRCGSRLGGWMGEGLKAIGAKSEGEKQQKS